MELVVEDFGTEACEAASTEWPYTTDCCERVPYELLPRSLSNDRMATLVLGDANLMGGILLTYPIFCCFATSGCSGALRALKRRFSELGSPTAA